MMKKVIAVLAGGCLLLMGLISGGSAKETDKTDGKELFESRCNACHSIERPKSKRKTKEGWTTTVMRMKNVNRCPITDEEAKMIIDYLSEEYGK